MDNDAITIHRHAVPEAVRERIKAVIVGTRINGYDDLIACAQMIAGEGLAGNIPPEMMDQVRKYLELMLSVLVIRNQAAEGSEGIKVGSVMDRLAKATKRSEKMLANHGPKVTVDVSAPVKAG